MSLSEQLLLAAQPELLDDEAFRLVQDVALRHFGFELPANKRTMLTRRMTRFARTNGLESAAQVVRTLLVAPTEAILQKLAVCLTTNHTFFHREAQHFERFVSHILPTIRASAARKEMRVWCAAASTGQEPYELAMCMREVLGAADGRQQAVLATDLSERVLDVARAGLYDEEQVSTLPKNRLRSFMVRDADGMYSVGREVRELVHFRRFNLLTHPYPFRRPFHAIFCRNVMIYFSASVKEQVLHKLSKSLVLGGYLFIGRSESARGATADLRFLEPGVYRKVSV